MVRTYALAEVVQGAVYEAFEVKIIESLADLSE
jgi:hypothetical protein